MLHNCAGEICFRLPARRLILNFCEISALSKDFFSKCQPFVPIVFARTTATGFGRLSNTECLSQLTLQDRCAQSTLAAGHRLFDILARDLLDHLDPQNLN